MKLNSIILNSKKNIKKWREILNKFPPENRPLLFSRICELMFK